MYFREYDKIETNFDKTTKILRKFRNCRKNCNDIDKFRFSENEKKLRKNKII